MTFDLDCSGKMHTQGGLPVLCTRELPSWVWSLDMASSRFPISRPVAQSSSSLAMMSAASGLARSARRCRPAYFGHRGWWEARLVELRRRVDMGSHACAAQGQDRQTGSNVRQEANLSLPLSPR